MEQGITILYTGKLGCKHQVTFCLSGPKNSQGNPNMGHPQTAIWGKSHLK